MVKPPIYLDMDVVDPNHILGKVIYFNNLGFEYNGKPVHYIVEFLHVVQVVGHKLNTQLEMM
jgi:hypothetical protein